MKSVSIKYPFVIALVWALVIFGMCCMPGRYIPSTDWLELFKADKWVHASIFFILQILMMRVLYLKQTSVFLYVIIFFSVVAYGGLLEIMQATLFSQRSADWYDFIANTFGVVMAVLLFKPLKSKLWLIN